MQVAALMPSLWEGWPEMERVQFLSIGHDAATISKSAEAVYWLSAACPEKADYVSVLEAGIHERFNEIARHLGYRVERIEAPAVMEAA